MELKSQAVRAKLFHFPCFLHYVFCKSPLVFTFAGTQHSPPCISFQDHSPEKIHASRPDQVHDQKPAVGKTLLHFSTWERGCSRVFG